MTDAPRASPLERLGPIACFAALAALLVLSNRLDWDQFLAFFEADRRAWLVDHRAPTWSYALCAGASRLGDPQAFGLSPLFVPVLALGAFWGSKVLAFLCVAAGWLAVRHGLAIVAPRIEAPLRDALSLFFVLGDAFLWHLHAGHVTFALVPLSCVLLALTLRAFRARFGWAHAALFALVGGSILSAGAYAAVVFFLVPATLVLLLPALVLVAGRPDRASLWRWLAAAAAALALSAPKWMGVLRYQRAFPRTLLPARHAAEPAVTLLQTLAYQLSPTVAHDFLAAPAWGPWDVWEYAALSGVSIAAVALLARGLGRARLGRPHAVFAVALLGYASLTRDEASPLSLHRALNAAIYAGSVRVIGRYGILLQLIALAFVAWRLDGDPALRAWARRWLVPAGFAVTLANLGSVLALADLDATRAAMRAPREAAAPALRFVRPRTTALDRAARGPEWSSSMYEAIAAGDAVANCYQPLRRPRAATTEATHAVPVAPDGTIALIDERATDVSEACRRSLALRATRIELDPAACPSDLCLNVNAVDPADPAWAFDEARARWCRRRGGVSTSSARRL